MKKQPRESLLMPILMPVVVLGGILTLTIGLGSMLLSMKPAAATATALVAAAALMVFALAAATRKRLAAGSIAAMVAGVLGVALFFGGALIAVVGGPEAEKAAGPAVPVMITAKNVLFAESQVTVPSDMPLAVTLDNQDAGIDHNVEIFDGPDSSAPVFFDGVAFPGVAKKTYDVDPLAEGSYYFVCKIHPTTMKGTITSKPGAEVAYGSGEPPATPSGGPTAAPTEAPTAAPTEGPSGKAVTLSVTAPVGAISSGFADTSLKAPAGAPITIEFDNQDTGVPHDVDIKSPDGEVISDNEIITGPATASYDVGPLEPGTYPYYCSVHPTTMTGTLTVK